MINDKHVETIVREMFSKKKIIDQGDTLFISGQLIDFIELINENEKVKNNPVAAIRNVTAFIFVTFSPRNKIPTAYIVSSINAKKIREAVPISMWLNA